MNLSGQFDDFLEFEKKVFGDSFPIANYDPSLIRYGEYRFVLETLILNPSQTVLDVGCEANILMLYLAYKGNIVTGVDLNPMVWVKLQDRKRQVEKATRQKLDITFKADDATRLSLEPNSFDTVIAVSSIEHMFSKNGNGDEMAVESIARVLKPGGLATITVPMSNGAPFHESPNGDARFGGSYRLYTPEVLKQRYLSNPALETLRLSYLANTTPDTRYPELHFHQFWLQALTEQERSKWAWAHPTLASIFNPIVTSEEGERRIGTLNTALICLRKKM